MATRTSSRKKKSPAQLDRDIATSLAKKSRQGSRGARKRQLVVEYDVAGLSGKQVDSLAGYAIAQGEASDFDEEFGAVNYPSVPVTSRISGRGKNKRLVVTYDVTGLSDDEIDSLTGSAIAQAEGNDAGLIIGGVPQNVVYPSVPVSSKIA